MRVEDLPFTSASLAFVPAGPLCSAARTSLTAAWAALLTFGRGSRECWSRRWKDAAAVGKSVGSAAAVIWPKAVTPALTTPACVTYLLNERRIVLKVKKLS